jgi:hypothetical protein
VEALVEGNNEAESSIFGSGSFGFGANEQAASTTNVKKDDGDQNNG